MNEGRVYVLTERGLAGLAEDICVKNGAVLNPEEVRKCLAGKAQEVSGLARGARSDFITRMCDLPEATQQALMGRSLRIMDRRIIIKQKIGASPTFKMVPEGTAGASNKYTLSFDDANGVLTNPMLVNGIRIGAVVDSATAASNVRFFDVVADQPVSPGPTYYRLSAPEEFYNGTITIQVGTATVILNMPTELFNNYGENTRQPGYYLLDNAFWIPGGNSNKVQITLDFEVATPANTWVAVELHGAAIQPNAQN